MRRLVGATGMVVLLAGGLTSTPVDAAIGARVTGGIATRGDPATEAVVPFPALNVDQTGYPDVKTDDGGGYAYEGAGASTTLDGTHVSLSDACQTINVPANATTGDIDLGTSAASDCSGGITTRAARTAYFVVEHLNQLARKWSSLAWLNGTVVVAVNDTATCNAFYNGSIVVVRSTMGCNNSGEIPDAIAFPWGQALTDNDSSILTTSSSGNAFGITTAVLLSHQSCIAPGFFKAPGPEPTCPTGVRDAARNDTTSANVTTQCVTAGTNPFGRDSVCEARLLNSALWTLVQSLVTRYGEHEGWHRFERLFFLGKANISASHAYAGVVGSGGCGVNTLYQKMLVVDDDDANTANGTPNMDLLYAAFNSTGLACSTPAVVANATTCLTPTSAPVVTTSSSAGAVTVNWTAVPGATHQILRRLPETGFLPFLPLGTTAVGVTTFVDSEAAPGFAYEYQVIATVAGCPSPLSASPASGGTNAARTITAAFSRSAGGFAGTVASAAAACVDGEAVALWKVRKGPDRRIGTGVTDDNGRYVIGKRKRPGKYYVTAPARAGCLEAKSRRLRFR